MSARTYLLAAGAFAIGTSGYIVSGVLPAVSEELHVSHATAGQLLTAFAIAYAISSPLLAALTGRWERRTLLVVALVVAALGNLLAALAPNYPLLLVARIVSALGAAVYTPAATLVATVLSPPQHRGRAVRRPALQVEGAAAEVDVRASSPTARRHQVGPQVPHPRGRQQQRARADGHAVGGLGVVGAAEEPHREEDEDEVMRGAKPRLVVNNDAVSKSPAVPGWLSSDAKKDALDRGVRRKAFYVGNFIGVVGNVPSTGLVDRIRRAFARGVRAHGRPGDVLVALSVTALAGVASLVAGAISMSLGEYTSVKTQNEQLDLEVWNSEGQSTFSSSADRPNNNASDEQGGFGTEFGGGPVSG